MVHSQFWKFLKTKNATEMKSKRQMSFRPGLESLEGRVTPSNYQHVLIMSVDGLREADLADPALAPYLTNIKGLEASGTTYTNASTSSPSDSFPGQLNYLTGAGPGTTGVFYDDTYNRTYLPPALVGSTTPGTEALFDQSVDYNSNNLSGTNSPSVGYNASAIDPARLPLSSVVAVTNESDAATTSTTTTTYQLQHSPIENDGKVTGSVNGATFTTSVFPGLGVGNWGNFDDVVDLNVVPNGTTLASGTLNLSTGLLTLTWTSVPQSSHITVSYNYGIPVYPHNDLAVNTIFGVVSAAGLPTAWIDKHPSYDLAAGPNGQLQQTTIDDLFTPEENSTVAIDAAHPAHPLVPGSDIMTQLVDSSYNPNNIPLPSGDATSAVSTSVAIDDIKVQALINEINGMNSLGTVNNKYSPSLFGMDFTAVNTAENLPTDPDGTPGGITINPATGQEILSSNIMNGFEATDANLGEIVAALKNNDGNSSLANFNNTLIVLTAKHGQNPRIGDAQNIGDPTTPVLTNAGINFTLNIEDDLAMIWLNPATAQAQSAAALTALQNYAKTSPYQEVDQILTGTQLAAMGYGNPILNNRTPDFIITLKPGFVYASSGPGAAISDHGGFTPYDTQVALILASGNSALAKNQTVSSAVSTTQVAVTALQALGLNPDQLQGAVIQNTQALPTAAPLQPGIVTAASVDWGSAGTATLQTAADGLRLLPTGRHTDLPWTGINELQITLNQPETLTAADVTIMSQRGAQYGPVTVTANTIGQLFEYDIVFAHPIVKADRVTITIAGPGIVSYTRRLDVLPGDFNDNGVVNNQDITAIRNEWKRKHGAQPTIFGEILGDGTVNASDYHAARKFIGTRLPKLPKPGGKPPKAVLVRALARQ